MTLFVIFLLFPCSLPPIIFAGGKPSFLIDYPNNQFLRDGKPFRYISGSIHYPRVPNYYWRDRLSKMRAAGLNAIEFYINWNLHEPYSGQYNFKGDANITRFLDIAKELGFVAIARLGPYTCGEWENGGLPWWLIKDVDIKMRRSDPKFLAPVKRWYDKLFPILLPYLYKNGGPIALIQIENEYGSRSWCDIVYLAFLRDLFRKYVGYDFVLITTDGGGLGYLKCGYIPDVYPTVDFGTGSKEQIGKSFAAQRTYAPRGPLVNSEFYPGWLDDWGSNFSTVNTDVILSSMSWMYQMNASFNFYMFEGTNFGYWNGAGDTQPVTTTYDYDAPLTEAGDPTPKLFAIRDRIKNLTGWNPPPVPPATRKGKFGKVKLIRLGTIIDLLDIVSPKNKRVESVLPLSMEQIDSPYGFVLYQTTVMESGTVLYAPNLKDRGYVMLDGRYKGVIIHQLAGLTRRSLNIYGTTGQKLQILVENRGRWSSGFNDLKGIMPNISLDKNPMLNWEMCPISLENLLNTSLHHSPKPMSEYLPSIYLGNLSIAEPLDTYFDPTAWSKGQFFINGHNVGRYWPSLGPQVTLYTPKTMLKGGANAVLLFELESPGNCESSRNETCGASFTDVPYLNKTVEPFFGAVRRSAPYRSNVFKSMALKFYRQFKNNLAKLILREF